MCRPAAARGEPSRDIVIRPSTQARRLSLRIDPALGRPVLTVPEGVSAGDVERFVRQHEAWIAERLARLPPPLRLVPGNRVPFRGRGREIIHDARLSRQPRVSEDAISLGGPCDQVEARLMRWFKETAREPLTTRARAHAKALSVAVGRISVRDTRSRWGSCSATGALSFSWRLVLAPHSVLDYVVAHEVAHRLEMNHSPRFWAHVQDLVGNPSPARAWLRRHGPSLFRIGPPRAVRAEAVPDVRHGHPA